MIVARYGKQNLEAVIRDIKKYTSIKLIEAIRDNDQESRKDYFFGSLKALEKVILTIRTINSGSNIVTPLI
jgi:hypothetical protein